MDTKYGAMVGFYNDGDRVFLVVTVGRKTLETPLTIGEAEAIARRLIDHTVKMTAGYLKAEDAGKVSRAHDNDDK